MTATVSAPGVLEPSEDELRQAVRDALALAGVRNFRDLAEQASSGQFTSSAARRAWVAVGGMERYSQAVDRDELAREAEHFARRLTRLLNGTVCNGPRVTSVIDPRTTQAVVGYGVTKTDLTGRGLPLTLGKKPVVYLGLSYRLTADDTNGRYLMVVASFVSLCGDAELTRELIHWDYERGKTSSYPEAHIQVSAVSEVWTEIAERCGRSGDPLQSLHLPVGGRRNRPTLEDIIDFLIVERLVDPRVGCEKVIRAGRDDFLEIQLKAAVRRHPDVARAALREIEDP